ncbi:hypothetical protein CDO52_11660 [Nocardiopsis gilva YIM 90087]|uniref:Lantibiotic ABC transporter permease n=1 Tax=Nocardiopsis gilva YIM 90087 TaxID=1235441 RepID=A0A223S5E6_9ACTN|nr:hypothetical protein [Nocardiopsis gilva]ASU83345.1 hypothetical protein CDO52_11660 [Nocardiopsis gilva YIM 90087]
MSATRTEPRPRARGVSRDDPSLFTVVGTELARQRGGFSLWFTLLLPAALVLPLGVIAAFSPEGQNGDVWKIWLNVVLMFWGILAPMAAALYAAVSVRQDDDARRLLYSYAFPRHRLFLGKFVALALVWLGSALILTALLSALAVALGQVGDIGTVAAGVLLSWLAGLGSLALCLLVAHMWGFATTICVGVAGMMFGALLADKSVWWAIPLAWPMRVVVPLAEVFASGVPLPPEHPLMDTGVIPIAIALSAALSVVLLAIGSRYVNRKEL